jgi:hypothetical protein
MKERGLKIAHVYQIIYVDCTKFGQISNDMLDQIVNTALACAGESELEPRTVYFFLLPTLASNELRGTRGLEGERMRLFTKLSSKSLQPTGVQIICSKTMLGNASRRKSGFAAFVAVHENTCPAEGAKATTAKKVEKREGGDEDSQINTFLFSQVMVNNCNDYENLPILLPEEMFVDPKKDLQNSMPEASSVATSTPTLIPGAVDKIMVCPSTDWMSTCRIQVATRCHAILMLVQYIRSCPQLQIPTIVKTLNLKFKKKRKH